MPSRPGRDRRGCHQEQWEPSEALTTALGDMPLSPGTDRNEDLAKLKPHLEESLVTLERLKRQRPFGKGEDVSGALRMLLSSIERVR